jgi:hypothetical protein
MCCLFHVETYTANDMDKTVSVVEECIKALPEQFVNFESEIPKFRERLFKIVRAEFDPCETEHMLNKKTNDFINTIIICCLEYDYSFTRADMSWFTKTEYFFYLYVCNYMDENVYIYHKTCRERYMFEGNGFRQTLAEIYKLAGLIFMREITFLCLLNWDPTFVLRLGDRVRAESSYYEKIIERVHNEKMVSSDNLPMTRALLYHLSSHNDTLFPFFEKTEVNYLESAAKYIMILTLHIPLIMNTPDSLFWTFAKQYYTLHYLDPYLQSHPFSARKVYVFLRCFTLTHLVMVHREVRRFVAESQIENIIQ